MSFCPTGFPEPSRGRPSNRSNSWASRSSDLAVGGSICVACLRDMPGLGAGTASHGFGAVIGVRFLPEGVDSQAGAHTNVEYIQKQTFESFCLPHCPTIHTNTQKSLPLTYPVTKAPIWCYQLLPTWKYLLHRTLIRCKGALRVTHLIKWPVDYQGRYAEIQTYLKKLAWGFDSEGNKLTSNKNNLPVLPKCLEA